MASNFHISSQEYQSLKSSDEFWSKYRLWFEIVSLHLGYIKPGANVFELGVSHHSPLVDLISPALLPQRYVAVGLSDDVSTLRQRQLQLPSDSVRLFPWTGSVLQLQGGPSDSAPYDTIVTWSPSLSLNMRSESQMRSFLQWVSASLKPGGVWLGCLPDSGTIWGKLTRIDGQKLIIDSLHRAEFLELQLTDARKTPTGFTGMEPGKVPAFGTSFRIREYQRSHEEYLVNIPNLLKSARLYDLYCVEMSNWSDLHAAHHAHFAAVFEKLGIPARLPADAMRVVSAATQFYTMFAFEKIPEKFSYQADQPDDILIDVDLISPKLSSR